jgi:hypothetical protein
VIVFSSMTRMLAPSCRWRDFGRNCARGLASIGRNHRPFARNLSLCICGAGGERALLILKDLSGNYSWGGARTRPQRSSGDERRGGRPLSHGNRREDVGGTKLPKRKDLRGGEVMPNITGRLHLEDSTLVRMEKIISIRNSVVGSGPHGASRPMGWTNSAAVLLDLSHEMDSIFHPVLDTGRPGGY